MTTLAKATGRASGLDILNCVLEDHAALRRDLAIAKVAVSEEAKREGLSKASVAFRKLNQAEGEVLLARAIQLDGTRPAAQIALEIDELTTNTFQRAADSVGEEQLAARISVLSDLLEWHRETREQNLFPQIRKILGAAEREEMGVRFREEKSRIDLAPVFQLAVRADELVVKAVG